MLVLAGWLSGGDVVVMLREYVFCPGAGSWCCMCARLPRGEWWVAAVLLCAKHWYVLQ